MLRRTKDFTMELENCIMKDTLRKWWILKWAVNNYDWTRGQTEIIGDSEQFWGPKGVLLKMFAFNTFKGRGHENVCAIFWGSIHMNMAA